MKILKDIFNKNEHYFEKGGKYANWYPMYEAFYSFLFSTKETTKTSVHVRDSLDTKRYMSIVLIALTPCALFGIFNAGFQAHKAVGESLDLIPVLLTGAQLVLPLIAVSYIVGLGVEFFSCMVRGHEVNEGFLVTGLLYPLTLPATMPLWQAAVGIAFGVVVGKEVFGGSGRNFLNPALTARAFVFFAYPAQMSGEVWTKVMGAKDQIVEGWSGATALAVAATTEAPQKAVDALQDAGFSLMDSIVGIVPGSIGETSVVMVLIGAFILLITGVGSWRTMLGSLLGAVSISILFNLFSGGTTIAFFGLPTVWQLSIGSYAFATVFMATDPVSSPGLESSRFIYGFLIGVLGMIIRVTNPAYPEGWMLAILLMNVFAPLIDHVMLERKSKKRIPNVI
ncbi:NADH:ubiquinone reductase (Na(+)-transporting) subunit B [Candidatus Marinamargulisbacteria bacterium SCGC AG-343-D04]|nr:NADH:ubiquinone reductase (Na(+)-transporting) subunit B [Candidatus Marinamargulisbacteria bacterium SCGC AG-343-D04]